MREHRYRGKMIGKGDWVYGCLVELDYHDSHDYVKESQIVLQNGHIYKVIPETVGEYTGKDDDNYKEIYEGDIIVDTLNPTCKLEVEYKEFYHSDGWTSNRGMGFDFENLFSNNRVRVIGNKFENPEIQKVDNGK